MPITNSVCSSPRARLQMVFNSCTVNSRRLALISVFRAFHSANYSQHYTQMFFLYGASVKWYVKS